jgi:hypothetical protein
LVTASSVRRGHEGIRRFGQSNNSPTKACLPPPPRPASRDRDPECHSAATTRGNSRARAA